MKHLRTFLFLGAAAFFGQLLAQVPYSYAPLEVSSNEISALGSGVKSQFIQGLTLFDPATDPALSRMKGLKIKGVRCYLRADYKQAKQKRSAILASTGSPGNNVRTVYVDFTAGWNDVLFDEPLPIGDERIYLGMQVYETIGSTNPSYPLVVYTQATVPQSCLVNQGKTSWEEYTDRGTLLIAALVDDEAAPLLQRTAYAQNTTHPQTVAPDADFTGGLYVHNFTAEPLRTLEISMQGEGAEQPTRRTIELAKPLPAYGSTVITTQLHTGTAEGTQVEWAATVTQFNGNEAQAGRPGTTRLYVTYDNFIRTPLVEEFTSQRCIACPQMSYFLEKAFEQYEGPYIYVSHHSGFAKDAFTSQADLDLTYVFGGYENEYNPAIMYNRAFFPGEDVLVHGIQQMAPEPYLEALAIAADMPAMAEVNLEATEEGIRVSGRVARDLITTPLYLSCYLVEDGIKTDDYPQLGMDDDDAPADLKKVFRHNGVILHYFTSEALGDLLQVQSNGSYSVTFPAVQKTGFGGTSRRYVAFVHKVNKNDLRDNQVLNATQLAIGQTAIHEVSLESETDNSPLGNPIGSQGIYDLTGRRLSPTRPLPHGLYLVGGRKVVVP
jgi:hypothetical protein